MLAILAVVSLWLSTFAGYRAADSVRAFIMLSILIASGVASFSFDGRRRAFWAGFFGTLIIMPLTSFLATDGVDFQGTMRLIMDMSSDLAWNLFDAEQIQQRRLVTSFYATFICLLVLAAASIVGLICVQVTEAKPDTF